VDKLPTVFSVIAFKVPANNYESNDIIHGKCEFEILPFLDFGKRAEKGF
jgi:hypothetical protein